MENINLLKVAVAALTGFMLGGLWYSPMMFLKSWEKEAGKSGRTNEQGRHPALVFGLSYVLAFLAALLLSKFLGPTPELGHALCWSAGVGLVFVGGSFGINYLFGGYSLKYWLINAGYHVVQFLLFGLVFGLWH